MSTHRFGTWWTPREDRATASIRVLPSLLFVAQANSSPHPTLSLSDFLPLYDFSSRTLSLYLACSVSLFSLSLDLTHQPSNGNLRLAFALWTGPLRLCVPITCISWRLYRRVHRASCPSRSLASHTASVQELNTDLSFSPAHAKRFSLTYTILRIFSFRLLDSLDPTVFSESPYFVQNDDFPSVPSFISLPCNCSNLDHSKIVNCQGKLWFLQFSFGKWDFPTHIFWLQKPTKLTLVLQKQLRFDIIRKWSLQKIVSTLNVKILCRKIELLKNRKYMMSTIFR